MFEKLGRALVGGTSKSPYINLVPRLENTEQPELPS